MSDPEIQMGYPLRWPTSRQRSQEYRHAAFRHEGRPLTLTIARRRLGEQIRAMTKAGKPWRVLNQVLSTNIRFTASGARDQSVSRRDPADPGVAFYFELDGKPHVLACDRWSTVQDNIAAIAAHVEALRGQERWGVGDLRQAFAGYTALPAPGGAPARSWREVLGFGRGEQVTSADVEQAYRRLAQTRHPDKPTGSAETMAELNQAREDARRAVGA
jgi:hypothetical protein